MRLILALLMTIALGVSVPDHARAADAPVDGAHAAGHQPNIMAWQWDTAVWTCVVFLLLFFILTKYAWTPILDGLKAREASITNVMEEAKRLREENARDTSKFRAELAEAYAKIPAMMEEARRDAAELKEQIRSEGNAEVQKERQRLLREIDIARDQALQEIWTQAANVATLIASKAVGRSLTGEDHHRLVDEALAEIKQQSSISNN